jgi:hypothetical protein
VWFVKNAISSHLNCIKPIHINAMRHMICVFKGIFYLHGIAFPVHLATLQKTDSI